MDRGTQGTKTYTAAVGRGQGSPGPGLETDRTLISQRKAGWQLQSGPATSLLTASPGSQQQGKQAGVTAAGQRNQRGTQSPPRQALYPNNADETQDSPHSCSAGEGGFEHLWRTWPSVLSPESWREGPHKRF